MRTGQRSFAVAACRRVCRVYGEQQQYDAMISVLRDAFVEDELSKLMSDGSAWNEDQAVAEAMLI